jgi:hypothetical protein
MGLAVLALLAVAAVSAASASAALPEYSASSTFTGTSGVSTLETTKSGTTIVCQKDTNSGAVTAKTGSGTFTVDFAECKSGAANCSSEILNSKKETEKDAKGIILTKGTTTLGYITRKPVSVGVLLKTETVKISCGEGALLAEVKGELICPITPVNSDVTAYTQKCAQSAKGVQSPKKFENTETEKFPEEFLLTSFNGGKTFEESSLVTEEKLTNATLGEIKA